VPGGPDKEPGRPAPAYETEQQARQAAALPPKNGLPGIDWTYLRFVKEPGRPGPEDLGAGRPQSFEPGQDGPAPFANPFGDIDVTSNLLPHWQQGEVWIFATWRLADSLPADKLRHWQEEKQAWLARHPEPWDPPTTTEYHQRFTQRIEDWLDAGYGACILRDPAIRQHVSNALAFFDGKRYALGDWVVMPNHVHVLFRPLDAHRLPDILHFWKSFTAKAINRHLGRTGPVWQEDYWDRLIRNERHLDAVQRYIAENPA
jgi:type I restriction enzyme R subunit